MFECQDGAGVDLRISTELNYFISGVNIAGESEPPNRNQLITATKLDLGALLCGIGPGSGHRQH